MIIAQFFLQSVMWLSPLTTSPLGESGNVWNFPVMRSSFASDCTASCLILGGMDFLAKTNMQLRTTANRLEVQNLKRQQYLRTVFFVPIRQRMETCSKMLNSTIFYLILAILFWPSNIRFGPLTYEYIRDLAV